MEKYININWSDDVRIEVRSLVEQIINVGIDELYGFDADNTSFLENVCEILSDHAIDNCIVEEEI